MKPASSQSRTAAETAPLAMGQRGGIRMLFAGKIDLGKARGIRFADAARPAERSRLRL